MTNTAAFQAVPHDVHARVHAAGLTVERYAGAIGLSPDFLGAQGLEDDSHLGYETVRVPYLSRAGVEAAVHYLGAIDADAEGQPSRWKSGTGPMLYGLDGIPAAERSGRIAIVSTVDDALTCAFHGVAAVALPPKSEWHEGWAESLAGVEQVDIVVEDGEDGLVVPDWFADSRLRERAQLVPLDGGSVNALHRVDADTFTAGWAAALERGVSWRQIREAEAWELCSELAEEEEILQRFHETLKGAGFAGATRIAFLCYLVLVSRLLDRPASLVIKGPGSAGKSYIVDRTLAYFPMSAFFARTGLSSKALYYTDESFEHRILVLYEANVLRGGEQAELVRSLLSEGKLNYEYTDFDAAGTRKIEKEGPTGLISTTTLVNLDEELETRVFSTVVPDTPEQTRVVVEASLLEEDDLVKVDLDPWLALQEWLDARETTVTIPYRRELGRLVDNSAVRMRRDVRAVATLVRAHALLHQATRQRDDYGRVVASIDDYAAVHRIVAEELAEGIGKTVPATVRETVATVHKLIAAKDENEDPEVAIGPLAVERGIDDSAARRRAYQALKAGYLRNLAPPKRPMRLVPGELMPEDRETLPSPEALEAACTRARTQGGNGDG